MIPKDTTPIKHKILTDIFAKRLLTLDEIAIVSYIIRWSWGFNGIEGRRQDWTRKLKKRKIADDMDMNRGKCCTILNRMIKEKKVKEKNGCYQFNEHFEEWQKFTKGKLFRHQKVYESETKSLRKVNLKVTKGKLKVYEKETLVMPNNQGKGIKNKDVREGEHMSKDTLKDNKDKKDKKIRFNFIKKEFTNLTKERMEEFDEKYPEVNIDQEIERMENWLMEEKEKRDNGEKDKIPKDYNRFINNWLRKEEQQ